MKLMRLHAAAAVLALAAALPCTSGATPPTVEIAAPADGAKICGTITVSASASDPGGIAGVRFQYDGIDIGSEATTAPYRVLANTGSVPDGSYVLTAIARNVNGEEATSAPVTVTVANAVAYCASKFIPTFLAKYAGAPLSAADAQSLGRYDALLLHRWRYGELSWSAIRAVNPNIKIFVYQMGTEDENFEDGMPQAYLQGVDRHNDSRGHSMGSLNGDHPELFLLDSLGNRIFNVNYSASGNFWYLMDFGSPTYQAYWLEATRTDVINQVWVADGVHADNCLTLISVVSPYSSAPVRYPDDASWAPAMNAFAQTITAGMHGNGQYLWCNRGYSRFDAGKAAWLSLDASPNPPDVAGEEGGFAVAWGPAAWATQFFSEAEWRNQADTLAAIRNSKVAVFSHTKLQPDPGLDSGFDNFGQPVTFWQTLWFALGSFLLGKNDSPNNAYFFFSGLWASFDRNWYFDEYDMLDLGRAAGTYAVSAAGGTNIYWREFEKGYVYVNPTANGATVSTPPGCTCRQRAHENLNTPSSVLPVVTSVQLGAHSATILLK